MSLFNQAAARKGGGRPADNRPTNMILDICAIDETTSSVESPWIEAFEYDAESGAVAVLIDPAITHPRASKPMSACRTTIRKAHEASATAVNKFDSVKCLTHESGEKILAIFYPHAKIAE